MVVPAALPATNLGWPAAPAEHDHGAGHPGSPTRCHTRPADPLARRPAVRSSALEEVAGRGWSRLWWFGQPFRLRTWPLPGSRSRPRPRATAVRGRRSGLAAGWVAVVVVRATRPATNLAAAGLAVPSQGSRATAVGGRDPSWRQVGSDCGGARNPTGYEPRLAGPHRSRSQRRPSAGKVGAQGCGAVQVDVPDPVPW